LTAHAIAKINHLNKKESDGFMKALLGERADLAGLPIAMGEKCRVTGERNQYFTQALSAIKRAKGQGGPARLLADPARRIERPMIPPIPQAPAVAPPPPSDGPKEGSTTSNAAQPVAVLQAETKVQEQINSLLVLATGFVPAPPVDPATFWDQFQKI